MVFHRLTTAKRYEPIEASLAFPFLRPEDIRQFIDRLGEADDTALAKAFLKHAKLRYEDWQAN